MPAPMSTRRILAALLLFGAGGCKTTTAAGTAAELARVERLAFNAAAAELALPLFWREDADADGALDPEELAVLWMGAAGDRAAWVGADGFTEAFRAAYARVAARVADGAPKVDGAEGERLELVRLELSQGRPTLVGWDFSAAPEADRAVVRHVLEATAAVERIHARQRGAFGLDAGISAEDGESRALFFRNQGPWCEAPATESNPKCSALAGAPARISGLYPESIQTGPDWCERINADPVLADHFAVVVEKDGALVSVPYHEAYREDSEQAARALEAAAAALGADEAPFAAYLKAAAAGFRSNDWEPANEAWAAMNVGNSKWYLRIGPDEVYFEPCALKAGYHVSFGRINADSLKWQSALGPLQSEMEAALAGLAGAPYAAREVSFHLPDFVDVVINGGDSRSASGATIGQSLPNWGPVANEGRGRTVAMTNFYTDADSRASLRAQASSLFCADTMAAFVDDPEPQLMSTVLHEAAHNLGPAHEYKVDGKTDDEVFGGPMASTLEELKAQTAALWFTDWLVGKGVIDAAAAHRAHVRDVTWSFGHISRGMYDAQGKPKPYSQLASIQLGALVAAGAGRWEAETRAANGTDVGCFALDAASAPSAIDALAKTVLGVKSRGDVEGAKRLIAEHVDAPAATARNAIIAERWLRAPKASFVYSIAY